MHPIHTCFQTNNIFCIRKSGEKNNVKTVFSCRHEWTRVSNEESVISDSNQPDPTLNRISSGSVWSVLPSLWLNPMFIPAPTRVALGCHSYCPHLKADSFQVQFRLWWSLLSGYRFTFESSIRRCVFCLSASTKVRRWIVEVLNELINRWPATGELIVH